MTFHLTRMQRGEGLPWLFLLVWALFQFPLFAFLSDLGVAASDFRAYQAGATAVERAESPYGTAESSLDVWRQFHHAQGGLTAARDRGEGLDALWTGLSGPAEPTPYLYPPTLALLLADIDVSAAGMVSLAVLSVVGFVWFWRRRVRLGGWWVLLAVLSLDVIGSLHSGNVELLLLLATLVGAWLLWRGRSVPAALFMAVALLVKPFYAMFFIPFGLLLLMHRSDRRWIAARSLGVAALIVAGLGALEAVRWEPELRAAAASYWANPMAHQWFTLPVPEQTPMSAWNRAPMQAIVNAGVPAGTAQLLVVGLWALFLLVTLGRARLARLTFPAAFALSLILLYLGRPVAWGFPYLELVLLTAAWPTVGAWRAWVLAAALSLLASRWLALLLTLLGHDTRLVTLQTADLPWEAWLVLPVAWLVLLKALPILSPWPIPTAAGARLRALGRLSLALWPGRLGGQA